MSNYPNFVIAAFIENATYFYANEILEKSGFTIADIPIIIQAMNDYPEVYNVIKSFIPYCRNDYLHYLIDEFTPDTRGFDNSIMHSLTCEYYGFRGGNHSYEMWHSVDSLVNKMMYHIIPSSDIDDNGFISTSDDEWVSVGKGSYNGQNIVRVESLEDLRKGDVPSAGTPFTVALRVPDDYKLVPLDANMTDVLQRHK